MHTCTPPHTLTAKDDPWCEGTVDRAKVRVDKLVLLTALAHIQLRVHHEKVDWAHVKRVPALLLVTTGNRHGEAGFRWHSTLSARVHRVVPHCVPITTGRVLVSVFV